MDVIADKRLSHNVVPRSGLFYRQGVAHLPHRHILTGLYS
jgi:hypothetical protein